MNAFRYIPKSLRSINVVSYFDGPRPFHGAASTVPPPWLPSVHDSDNVPHVDFLDALDSEIPYGPPISEAGRLFGVHSFL